MKDIVDVIMGPVLYFRGISAGRCQLAALMVTSSDSAPPDLTVHSGDKASPEKLAERLDATVWRYTFSVGCEDTTFDHAYAIGSHTWPLSIPGNAPLRVAFTACNGSETDEPAFDDPNRNERWRHLAEEHAKSPIHLLLQGGDQMYADRIWQDVPDLKAWHRLGRRARIKAPMPPETLEAVGDFYFQRYCRLWSQPELATLVASIPSLMMWDDHDIFDGWGSHPTALQGCPTYRGIWSMARYHFALFQLAARPDALPDGFGDSDGGHFGWSFKIGDIGIIAPDLRSARTRSQVMNETGWDWLGQSLQRLRDCQHVLMISTVPVAHIGLRPLERLLCWMPREQLYQDDLRDQWQSFAHEQEWHRLVKHALDFSEQTQTAVTFLSGEIHLGAFGCLERGATKMFQLISSGVVHPAPPALMAQTFNWMARRPQPVTDDIQMRMLDLPHIHSRYLAARNWLSIEHLPNNSLDVQWHVEEMAEALQVTIRGPAPQRAHVAGGDST